MRSVELLRARLSNLAAYKSFALRSFLAGADLHKFSLICGLLICHQFDVGFKGLMPDKSQRQIRGQRKDRQIRECKRTARRAEIQGNFRFPSIDSKLEPEKRNVTKCRVRATIVSYTNLKLSADICADRIAK